MLLSKGESQDSLFLFHLYIYYFYDKNNIDKYQSMNIKNQHKKFLSFFKAVCDVNRHHILALLKKEGELNASDIIKHIKLSQPTVSHHLKILVDSEILETRKDGKETFYKINEAIINKCCKGFASHFCQK